MTLIREQLRQTLVDEEDAGQLTSAGRKALERFRKCKAGDQPRVSSLWCSAVAKMVHAGLDAKDKPADALANAGDLQSGVGGGTAGVQFHTPPELEEELASLRAKMSGKMSDVLSIQAEPKRSGGTKGVGTVGTAGGAGRNSRQGVCRVWRVLSHKSTSHPARTCLARLADASG